MNYHRTTSKERRLSGQRGPLPAWWRYRIIHRAVRVVMSASNGTSCVCTFEQPMRFRLFVVKYTDIGIGFCVGEMAREMRDTFLPNIPLEVCADEAAWKRLRWSLPAVIDDALANGRTRHAETTH